MEAYQRTVEEALQEQHSSMHGLSEAQAQERSSVFGLNKLQEEKKASLLKRLARQLSNPMIIVLLGAALISGITSAYAHESYADTFIILFVVMVNAMLGLYQEGKAEAAIEALKHMNAPACKVVRNGEIRVTASEDLVPGDVIVLEAGDAVPADGRILECASLKVEESALSGESLPVEKQTEALQEDNPPLGDRRNMVYMGSSVVYGRGRAVITATGMHTEMGKIADAILVSREEATPLQQKLAGLEAKLPAALSTRAAALALSVVVMLAAFLGFGSAKLHSRYNEVRKWYTVGVAADNGYNLNEELTTRMNTAANIITTAGSTLGADSAEVQAAQSALSDLTACLEAVQNGGKSQALTSLPYYQGSTMHALYQANEVLGSRIDQLYAKLQEQAADPMKMGAVQGQYGQFNSAATIIGTLKYNDAVYDYQKETGGFPASVLGAIAGVKEVEPCA